MGEILFNFGDPGYYFYVILKGTVGIKIPLPVEQNWDIKEFIDFLALNYKDVWWQKMENSEELKAKAEQQLNLKNQRRGTVFK